MGKDHQTPMSGLSSTPGGDKTPAEKRKELRKKQRAAREKLCCFFFPLRGGLCLAALLTMGYGLAGCIELFSDGLPVGILVGGFSHTTTVLVAWMGAAGVIGGWWGVIGCYDNNVNSLRYFYYFCILRTIAGTAIFVIDALPLYRCETYGTDLKSRMYHNPMMHRINQEGHCSWVRGLYVCGWLVDLFTACYTIFVTHIYIQILRERDPVEYSVRYERRKELPKYFLTEANEETPLTKGGGGVPDSSGQLSYTSTDDDLFHSYHASRAASPQPGATPQP